MTEENILPSYYQKTILNLINTIKSDFLPSLNNEEDTILSIISTKLSSSSQRLLFRLILRMRSMSSNDDDKGIGWFPIKKLSYKDIEGDMEEISIELIRHSFLLYACYNIKDFPQNEMNENINGLLSLQTMQELKELALNVGIDKKITGMNREAILDSLLKKSNQKRLCNYWNIYSTKEKEYSFLEERREKIIIASQKKLGMIVKVPQYIHNLFDRMVTLYNIVIPSKMTTSNITHASSRLSEIILNELEDKRLYMTYEVERSHLFPTREDSIEYENSLSFLMAVDEFEHSKVSSMEDDGLLLSSLKMDAIDRWKKSIIESPTPPSAEEEYFLSRYKSSSIIAKALHVISSLLEKNSRYPEANEILYLLIDQKYYLRERRLRWLERLSLNLQKHLKLPKESLLLLEGNRPFPRDSYHSISLERRYLSLISKNDDCNYDCNDAEDDALLSPKKLIIYCDSEHSFQKKRRVGAKLEYFDGMGVEEMVLRWFDLHFGFGGEHSEGAVIVSLFGLLFWDILFLPGIPKVFQSPYQTYPLDLMVNDSSFYLNRKEIIDERMSLIKGGNLFSSNFISSIPSIIHNRKIIGVDWERKDEMIFFVKLMEDHPSFSELFWPFINNYREASSGLPDLFLYRRLDQNPSSLRKEEIQETSFKFGEDPNGFPFGIDWKFIMVEVKSPRDKLSDHQRWWNDYLLKSSMPILLVQVLETSEEGKSNNKKKEGKQ